MATLLLADTKLPWEHWARYCYPPELNTEWFVAEDHGPAGGPTAPENFVIHSLVQPRVIQVDHQWEITFDPVTKKKPLLNSHFDNAKATDPVPGGFRSNPQSERYWYDMALPGPTNFWLIIKSRENLDGKFTPLNYDPDHTGKPTQYTLIPNNAVLTSFYEPQITPQEGEWSISFPKITTEQRKNLTTYAADWLKHHPGPKLPPVPPIRYSATMQKQYDEWWKAQKAWQQAGGHGLSPVLEDFFHFTPEQAAQYAAWQKARRLWYATGQGPFPQPIDFLPEPPSVK